jgi:ectoine hydroxylase-related dioxygenase (phytanoyl-CoA dioxygenase family)
MSGSGTFAVDGYTLIPALLDESVLRVVQEEVQRRVSLPHDSAMSRVGNDLVPLRWHDPIVTCVFSRTSALERIRETVAATDLRWISGYISSKAPATAPLWWHQDWWCWDHPISFALAAPQIAVLCYLSNTSDETGALRVLPGSHLRSLPIHAELPEPHSTAAEQLAPDHPALNHIEGQVTLSLSRGDAVVIDYRLLHGTHPNHSSSRRDALLLSFTPDWSSLPDEIRAHLAMHPALPTTAERSKFAENEGGIFPWYDGTPASLPINRRAPVRQP